MRRVVLKFGGTSLGDAERLARAAEIVESRRAYSPWVVTSAMGGVTDALLEAAARAGAGDEAGALARLDEIGDRHRRAAEELGVSQRRPAGLPESDLQGFVAARLGETRDRLRGVSLLGELTERTRDAIVAIGELCASALLAAVLPDARWCDIRPLMRTDDDFGGACPDRDVLSAALAAERTDALVVTQGFIGATSDGVTTTLGRGGSDYTASLIGASLGVDEIEIWTDVDGMLTADPRVVPEARLLAEISFEEASELAYFGARVLHPATIRPAVARDIAVRILNTFRPEGSGTAIRRVIGDAATPVRAVAMRKGITIVRVENPRMLMSHGWSGRVFEAFGRHRVSVDLIATSEVSISLTVDDPRGLSAVVAELGEMAEVTVVPDGAIVAVVGRGMRHRPRVASRVFGSLGDINVLMISMGASDRNLSFVVNQADADEAIRRLHHEFFGESS